MVTPADAIIDKTYTQDKLQATILPVKQGVQVFKHSQKQSYHMQKSHTASGYVFAFTAAACWALLGPIARLPLSHGISALEVAFWRAFFGACFFIAHGLVSKQYRINHKDGLVLGSFGIVGIAFFFAVYQMAVQRSGAAMASVLLYTAPMWVAIFSRLLFKERLTPVKISAMLIAMGGVSLVCLSGGGLPEKTDLLGIVCGLLAGFSYSLHYVYGSVYLKRISSVTLYMYCLPVGALVLLPLVEFAPKQWDDWLAMLGLGLICTYAAYAAYCEALKRLAPTRVAVLCNIEPLLAALLAFVFWNELFSTSGWIGSILVLAAVFLMMSDKRD